MIVVSCPVCMSQIILDESIHLMDDVERTEYCEDCTEILTIKNRRVIRPTINEVLGILGE